MSNRVDYSRRSGGCQFDYANIFLQNGYNSNMRLTTRLRILDYLRRHHTATASELTRFLAMTGANVRYHLAVLEANQLVEVVGRRHEGPGRPAQVYGLSRHVLGDGLDELTAAMFDEWMQKQTAAEQEAALVRIAARLAGKIPAMEQGLVPLPRRLADTLARLNELHYQARWEAGATGPKIILEHCPYAAVLNRVPALCRMDAFLLETLLQMPMRQVVRMEPEEGDWQCVFQPV